MSGYNRALLDQRRKETAMSGADRGRLLTPQAASDLYGIGRGKIYAWVRARRFSFIKPSREVLFWERDFLLFLEEHRVPARDEESIG